MLYIPPLHLWRLFKKKNTSVLPTLWQSRFAGFSQHQNFVVKKTELLDSKHTETQNKDK